MTKQELLAEARKLSKIHEEKKELIKGILDKLDGEKIIGEKHINGMTTVNIILQEIKDIELKHSEILLKIKN